MKSKMRGVLVVVFACCLLTVVSVPSVASGFEGVITGTLEIAYQSKTNRFTFTIRSDSTRWDALLTPDAYGGDPERGNSVSVPREFYYDGSDVRAAAHFPENPADGEANSSHIMVWNGPRPTAEGEKLWLAFFSGDTYFVDKKPGFVARGLGVREYAIFEDFEWSSGLLSPRYLVARSQKPFSRGGVPCRYVSKFEWLSDMDFGGFVGPKECVLEVTRESDDGRATILDRASKSTIKVSQIGPLTDSVGLRSGFPGRTVVDDMRLARSELESPISYSIQGGDLPARNSDLVRAQYAMQRPQPPSRIPALVLYGLILAGAAIVAVWIRFARTSHL